MHKIRLRSGRSERRGSRTGNSYANIAATLALVLAVAGGTAYAAQRYVITSTKQIAPSVLKKLHGAQGRRGSVGTNGTNGTNGPNGAAGPTGPTGIGGTGGMAGATGPAGVTGAAGSSAASVLSGRVLSIPITSTPGQTTVYGAASGTSTENATESSVQTLSANASFTAQNLIVVKTGAAVGAGDQIIVDMDVGGSPVLICGIQPGQTSCTSSTQTASVAAGSMLSIKIIAQATVTTIPGFDLLFGFQAS